MPPLLKYTERFPELDIVPFTVEEAAPPQATAFVGAENWPFVTVTVKVCPGEEQPLAKLVAAGGI